MNKINPFLIFLLTFSIAINLSGIYSRESFSEFHIVEILQNIFLISSLIVNIKNKKLFLKNSTLLGYVLRISLFIFLFYEEISFITSNQYFSYFNENSEINIHNNYFWGELLFKNINLPFLNGLNFSLTSEFIVHSTALFIIGFGIYIPFLKRINIVFLEKKLSPYFLIYTLNIVLSSILRNYLELDISRIIDSEIIELFLYIVLFLDSILKINSMKKIYF